LKNNPFLIWACSGYGATTIEVACGIFFPVAGKTLIMSKEKNRDPYNGPRESIPEKEKTQGHSPDPEQGSGADRDQMEPELRRRAGQNTTSIPLDNDETIGNP